MLLAGGGTTGAVGKETVVALHTPNWK